MTCESKGRLILDENMKSNFSYRIVNNWITKKGVLDPTALSTRMHSFLLEICFGRVIKPSENHDVRCNEVVLRRYAYGQDPL